MKKHFLRRFSVEGRGGRFLAMLTKSRQKSATGQPGGWTRGSNNLLRVANFEWPNERVELLATSFPIRGSTAEQNAKKSREKKQYSCINYFGAHIWATKTMSAFLPNIYQVAKRARASSIAPPCCVRSRTNPCPGGRPPLPPQAGRLLIV